MKYYLYCVKDVKLTFGDPFILENDLVCFREVKNLVNDSNKNIFNTNIEDKELWKLGEYDKTTGAIIPDLKFLYALKDFVEVTA